MAWAFPTPAAKHYQLRNSYKRTGYSSRRLGYHWGIDLPAPMRSKAKAIRRARVHDTGNVWGPSYGKQVLLKWRTSTGKQRFAFYSHLDTIAVRKGERVRKNQTIGRVGSTGNSTGPHVHFEYGYSPRWDMKRFNPYRKLERARRKLLAS